MCRWCSQIASDHTECSFNPSRLVSAPPPPSSSPCSRTCPLSPSSLIQHMVYRGVSTQLPLIKIIGISILHLILFCSPFSLLLHTRKFSQYPLLKKCIPFFPLIINPKILFPLSSLSQFLLFLNKYANYLYRRNWNLAVNPDWLCPWFYGGERQIVRLATPVLWLFPSDFTSEFPISNYFNFQNFC